MSEEKMWYVGGLLIAIVAGFGLIWAVGGDWWATRKLRKAGALRRCRKCLFDMSGLTTLVCPECGKKAKSEKSLRGVRRRWGVVAVCIVMLSVSWVVRTWPQMRDGRLKWVPTWALVMGESVVDLLQPNLETDLWEVRNRILSEVQERYKSGEVSPISDLTLKLSRNIWKIDASRRCREIGIDLVETRFNLNDVVSDDAWQQSALPEWPDDEDAFRGGCGLSYMSRTHVKLRDWTLFKWNRRKQYQCYRSILEVVAGLAEHDDTYSTRCELDLSGRELIRWGDAVDVPYARAILKEIKEAGEQTRRQPDAWFTQGTVVGEEMVQVFYWPRNDWSSYGDSLDSSISRVTDREENWECEPIARRASFSYNGYEIHVVRLQPQWHLELCTEFFEALKLRGVVVVDP